MNGNNYPWASAKFVDGLWPELYEHPECAASLGPCSSTRCLQTPTCGCKRKSTLRLTFDIEIEMNMNFCRVTVNRNEYKTLKEKYIYDPRIVQHITDDPLSQTEEVYLILSWNIRHYDNSDHISEQMESIFYRQRTVSRNKIGCCQNLSRRGNLQTKFHKESHGKYYFP